MPTETACTTAVATVMPISTGQGLNRVAKVRAMSWDLSPSSATKMTAKLIARAARKTSTRTNPGIGGPGGSCTGRLRPGRRENSQVEGLARPGMRAARPDTGNRHQHVDRDIGSYSPSRYQHNHRTPRPWPGRAGSHRWSGSGDEP